jgi:hypothetical protein
MVPVLPPARAAQVDVDLDDDESNGAESRIETNVLQAFPVEVENVITNNASGDAFIFVWPGAGPGGFTSVLFPGPDVGTKWEWSTVSQVYPILSPATFYPSEDPRELPVFGAPQTGIGEDVEERTFGDVPGRSIFPTQVTVSSASLTSSLITFFSPEETVATCGGSFENGVFEQTFFNAGDEPIVIAAEQQACCPDPQMILCGEDCYFYLTDPNNCGGCGIECEIDEYCNQGTCEPICPPGQTLCGEECFDLQNDPNNCGECGLVCAWDEFCDQGSCQPICPEGQTLCGEECFDLQNDPNNCGECGIECGLNEICELGTCVGVGPAVGQTIAIPVPGIPEGSGTKCSNYGRGWLELKVEEEDLGPGVFSANGLTIEIVDVSLNAEGEVVVLEWRVISPFGTSTGTSVVDEGGVDATIWKSGSSYVEIYDGWPTPKSPPMEAVFDINTNTQLPGGVGGLSHVSWCFDPDGAVAATARQGGESSTVALGNRHRTRVTGGPVAPSTRLAASRSVTDRRLARRQRVIEGTSVVARQTTGEEPQVEEAPVCDVPEVEPVVIPPGESVTQCQSGAPLGTEVFLTTTVQRDGETVAAGPCAVIVPVDNAQIGEFVGTPFRMFINDESGDGLPQPGERINLSVEVQNVGTAAFVAPTATLGSPPDDFNTIEIAFATNFSPFPDFPAYEGGGDCDTPPPVPVALKNEFIYRFDVPAEHQPDVGRVFVLTFEGDASGPLVYDMPFVLGIGRACDPVTDIDGETFDGLQGLLSPVSADLRPKSSSIDYSVDSFPLGTNVPLRLRLFCGDQRLGPELDPTPEVIAIEHETLGPQPLDTINGGAAADPADPFFVCDSIQCAFQLNPDGLAVGVHVISIRMPDSRIYRAGFTIGP